MQCSYGAFVPVLIYSLFGSSRELAVGPVAVTSLLISSSLKNVIPGADEISNPNSPPPDLVRVPAQPRWCLLARASAVTCLRMYVLLCGVDTHMCRRANSGHRQT